MPLDIKSIVFDCRYRIYKQSLKVVSDEAFARWVHWYLHKRVKAPWKPLNLTSPTTFSEKLTWLKLHHRFGDGAVMADKYAARTSVSNAIGERYLIPMAGVFDRVEDIRFTELPRSCVLKATHGSGWNIVCDGRSPVDSTDAQRRMRRWLGYNYYYVGREWQYRECVPRILCEHHLSANGGPPPLDYKLFCFHGEPKYIQVDIDRYSNHSRNFYDANWNRQEFAVLFPRSDKDVERPAALDEMIDVARALSKGLVFARIDLYYHGGRIHFGEITLHPGGGCEPFFPAKFDELVGEHLRLPM